VNSCIYKVDSEHKALSRFVAASFTARINL